jgi:hypothetical protein
LGQIVICGDGGCDLPSAEGKCQKRAVVVKRSWRYYCIEGEWKVYEPLRNNRKETRGGLSEEQPTKQVMLRSTGWRSSLLGDPGAKFLCGKLKKGRKKKEEKI